MTSYAEIQTAVQAIKLGASDYIAKPLNPEELLGKIKDVIKNGNRFGCFCHRTGTPCAFSQTSRTVGRNA